MSSESKRYYIEIFGYFLIITSIIFSVISAVLAYNPAGADPSALGTVAVSVVFMVVGIFLVRLMPWKEPKSVLDTKDDDEFVF